MLMVLALRVVDEDLGIRMSVPRETLPDGDGLSAGPVQDEWGFFDPN